MVCFDSLFLKRENVEWSGAESLNERPRKVLKQSLSFYPVKLPETRKDEHSKESRVPYTILQLPRSYVDQIVKVNFQMAK